MESNGDSDSNMSEDYSNTHDTEPSSPDATTAAITKVNDYFSSPETWLEGRTGLDAVDEISNVEFEITRILDDDAGEEGRRFRETAEYVEGMDKLNTMKQQCEATAATGAAPPPAAGAARNSLGWP